MAIGVSKHGSVNITGEAEIGITGQPKYVYAVCVTAGSGGAATVVLRNGTTSSGTVYVTCPAVSASKGDIFILGEGIHFPDGCFVDFDANTSSVTVSYDENRI